MIRKIIITIFLITLANVTFSQSVYTMKEKTYFKNFERKKFIKSTGGLLDSPFFTILGITSLLINPVVIYENKKVEFGLTKEISLALFPLGRFSFEYSRIFRGFSQNHFRFSYNYDFYKTNDFVAYGFSPGAGYFSDTKLNGYFFQISYGLLFPVEETLNLALHPYIKLRYTVLPIETIRNFADISLGMGIYFYTGIH